MRTEHVLFCFAALLAIAPPAVAENAVDGDPPRVAQLLDEARSGSARRIPLLALKSYCAAARLGSVEAMYRAGMIYAAGSGVRQNGNEAFELLSAAASQGHQLAAEALTTLARNSADESIPICLSNPEEIKPIFDNDLTMAVTGWWRDDVASMTPARRQLLDLVRTLAERHLVDPELVLAIIAVESGFNSTAVSPKNARGLMQLIPDTAQRFKVKNAFNPEQNILGGVSYLRWLLSYYRGDVMLVAAAYNAGENAVDRYRGVPPYAETRAYVKRVGALYRVREHPYEPTLAGAISPFLSAAR